MKYRMCEITDTLYFSSDVERDAVAVWFESGSTKLKWRVNVIDHQTKSYGFKGAVDAVAKALPWENREAIEKVMERYRYGVEDDRGRLERRAVTVLVRAIRDSGRDYAAAQADILREKLRHEFLEAAEVEDVGEQYYVEDAPYLRTVVEPIDEKDVFTRIRAGFVVRYGRIYRAKVPTTDSSMADGAKVMYLKSPEIPKNYLRDYVEAKVRESGYVL